MRIPVLAALLIAAAAPFAAAGVEGEVHAGHGGRILHGCITPIRVKLRSTEAEPVAVTVEARIGQRLLTGETSTTQDFLPPGAEREIVLYVRASEMAAPTVRLAFDRDVEFRVRGDDRVERSDEHEIRPNWAYATVVESAQPFLFAVGPQATTLPRLLEHLTVAAGREEDLPTRAFGYDGIDVLYLRNPAEAEPLDAAVVDAMLEWVSRGGRLVVSATRRPELLAAGGLAEALPAKIGTPLPDRNYDEVLRALLRRPLRREEIGSTPGPLAPLLPIRGKAAVAAGDLVLAVTDRRGFGQIIVLGFDPARLAAAGEDVDRALANLMLPPDLLGLERDSRNHYQYDDPAGGIAEILRLNAVTPPPLGLIALFMFLYVALVGPVDYIVLKRLNLLKYSAFSFLLIAVVFSALAWFVSFWLFAGDPIVNRLTIVDVAPEPGGGDLLAIQDLSGVYLPRGGEVELTAEGADAHYSDLGRSFGALFGASGLLPQDPIRRMDGAPPRALVSLPFRALRQVRTDLIRRRTLPLELSLGDGDEIEVKNGLAFPLYDVTLVTPAGVIAEFGDVSPGETSSRPQRPAEPYHRSTDMALLARQLAEFPADATTPLRRRIGRALYDLSFSGGSTGGHHPVAIARSGLDRTRAREAGATLLLAWTDARDPFGLPGADESGFSYTLIRKVVFE